MATREDYERYKLLLGTPPEWLKKYLDLDILTRLKDISLLCGMEYASHDIYDFAFSISRYEHSLNVALITWYLTHDKNATLAALFHDVSSPVFSHCIDYMNGDFINQESTEEPTEEVLSSSEDLKRYLYLDHIMIDDIKDFKQYSVVDLPRPYMCADRLDNSIGVGMAWSQKLTYEDAKKVLESIRLTINENGIYEISFIDSEAANIIYNINNDINRLTHSNSDTYMMLLVSKIIRKMINLKLVTYEDLYKLIERDIIDILEDNNHLDEELEKLYEEFKNIKEAPIISQPEIKDKTLNPLVKEKRLK
jgi:HD superfamily phosphohydrolase